VFETIMADFERDEEKDEKTPLYMRRATNNHQPQQSNNFMQASSSQQMLPGDSSFSNNGLMAAGTIHNQNINTNNTQNQSGNDLGGDDNGSHAHLQILERVIRQKMELMNQHQTSSDLMHQQQNSSEMMHQQQTSSEMMHQHQTSRELIHQNQTSSEMMHQRQTSSDLMNQLQSSCIVEQDNVTNIYQLPTFRPATDVDWKENNVVNNGVLNGGNFSQQPHEGPLLVNGQQQLQQVPTYARVVQTTSHMKDQEEDTLTKIRNLGTFGFQNLG